MKNILIVALTIFASACYAQFDSTIDNYKPYLIEKRRITGANTAALNKDLGQTTADTLHYWIIILDTTSGITARKRNGEVTYNFIYGIRGYGLWVIDPVIGNHWDLFDEKFRLLRDRGVIITQIIELTSGY